MRILLAVDAPSTHIFPLPHGWADRGHGVDVLMDAPDGRFGHARGHVHPGVRLLQLARDGSVLDAVSGDRTETTLPELIESADAVIIGGYATRVARRLLRERGRTPARMVLLAERPAPRASILRRRLRDAWARRALRRVDAVWSMSAAGDVAFARLGKAPEARVPYPAPLRRLPGVLDCNAVRERWLSARQPHLLFVGKMIERKRPLVAVEVVRQLSGDGMDVRADLVGVGDLEPAVRVVATGLPITLHGNVSPTRVEELLARSNVLLHPASHDGWGMAVTEAACRGVPVVATTGCDAATELAAKTDWVRVTDGSPAAMSRAAAELMVAFRKDPVGHAEDLIQAVEEVCGAERIVDRSLRALGAGAVAHG